MKITMKCQIGRIEYIYVVFDTIQLDLNFHNNVYIEEEGLRFTHVLRVMALGR